MSQLTVFNILLVIVVASLIGWSIRLSRLRKQKFKACGDRLGLENFAQTATSIEGKLRGRALLVRFISGSKNSPSYTTIEIACEPCAILLSLRRQDESEEKAVRSGKAIDLLVGDPHFDALWIVEGAPAERILRIFSSQPLRARLMAFGELINPSLSIEDGKLLLRRDGTDVDATEVATERIELALALAEAIGHDAATPLEPGEIDIASADYRSARRLDPDVAGAAKIVELKLLRANRSMAGVRAAAIGVHSILTLLMVGFGFSSPPGVAATLSVPFILFAFFLTLGVLSNYRSAKKSAPTIELGKLTVWWMVGCWVIDFAMIGWVIFK